jgi:hypothetical protein
MTRLIVDATTLARLRNLHDVSEVCDESGQVLGYFHPILPSGAAPGQSRSPFPDAELQRRREQRTGRPLAEILERLDRT